MGSKKDIGKAYKEQLESYASSPHNRVWENIEAELKKSKRRIFPIWKILTGFAILLLVSSISIYSYYNTANTINNTLETEQSQDDVLKSDSSNNTDNHTLTNTKTTNANTNKNNPVTDLNLNSENSTDNDKLSVTNTNFNTVNTNSNRSTTSKHSNSSNNESNKKNAHNTIALSNTKSLTIKNTNQNTSSSSLTKNNTALNRKNTVASNKNLSNTSSAISTDSTTNNLKSKTANTINLTDLTKSNDSIQSEDKAPVDLDVADLIDEEEKDETKKIDTPEKVKYPLTFSAYVSPTFTNIFGEDSSIDPRLDNNKTSGRFNINYGVAATVKISEKSSLRFGLGATQLSYTIKGADTTSTADAGGLLSNASGYSNLTVTSQASNAVPNIFDPNSVIDFQQKIKYLETPLSYIYHLKDDAKINIDVIGGFSALFLTNQSIIAKDRDGNSLKIGEVENLKKVNFSFNLGSNLSYSLTEKLHLNVEPTFKYYLSTYSNNVDTKPYSFGLSLGISYRF